LSILAISWELNFFVFIIQFKINTFFILLNCPVFGGAYTAANRVDCRQSKTDGALR